MNGHRTQTCATCAFAEADGAGGRACRRNPPSAFLHIQARPNLAGGNDLVPNILSAFPPVQEEHWCGEHEPRATIQLSKGN